MPEVYSPAEDSYLFTEFLKESYKSKDNSKLTFLDMGSGSGIIADTAKTLKFKEIYCSDININAIKIAKEKNFKTFHSNLFEKIPLNQKFDIICFNAPYLPEDSREPKTSKTITTGGKKGDEISLKFISQAKTHLNKKGKIYLLISNLTPFEEIKKHNPIKVKSKKIFFEELIILEIN